MENQDEVLDKWWFNPNPKSSRNHSNELALGRTKVYLYESLYRCITKHQLYESFQLVSLLPKVITIDPYALFRFLMILVESNDTYDVNKNVLFHLETLISKLYVNQPDIFVEFLAYFVKNNRIDDAKELFSARNRFMVRRVHQKIPVVDTNIKCYEFYFIYLEWLEKYQNGQVTNLNTDLSFQGKLVNILDHLKSIKTNHEYFVICVLQILIASNHWRKAYLFASVFHENNPDNLSAVLIHFHLLKELNLLQSTPTELDNISIKQQELNKLRDLNEINNFSAKLDQEETLSIDEYPFHLDKRMISENLKRLDPSRRDVLDQLDNQDNLVAILDDLLGGLETISELKNVDRWLELKGVLLKIFQRRRDQTLIEESRSLWRSKYRRYWTNLNLDKIVRSDLNLTEEVKIEILHVYRFLSRKLDFDPNNMTSPL